jgi:hypothetical protein
MTGPPLAGSSISGLSGVPLFHLLGFTLPQDDRKISYVVEGCRCVDRAESWRNLNLHKNRKRLSDKKPRLPRHLAARSWSACATSSDTASTVIGSRNHAAKIKGSSAIAKKFGLEPDEERRVWAPRF